MNDKAEHAELIEKARSLFDEGKSINTVAKELGITWDAARKLKVELYGEPEPAPVAEAGSASGEDEDVWDLPIRVPEDRAQDIFAGFTVDEQMDAIRHVLQERMDAVLAPADETGTRD